MGIKHHTRVAGTDISKSAWAAEDHDIAGGTIVTADIADGAITSAKIAEGTIVKADLAEGITEIPCSFLIYKSGSTYYARNGSTGAILTSGADASTVIQAALNGLPDTGGKIVLKGTFDMPTAPQGVTIITNTYIVNSKNNLTIEGEGKGKTIINMPGQTLTIAPNFFFSSGYDHIRIRNLSIVGNSVSGSPGGNAWGGYGVWFEDCSDILVEDCDFINLAQGAIQLSRNSGLSVNTGCSDVHIVGNRIIAFYNSAICVTNSHKVWIQDNYICVTDTPIVIGANLNVDTYQIFIENNILDWFGQAGMPTTVANVMGISIFASIFDSSNTHDISISDNIIYPGCVDMILITESGAGAGTNRSIYNIDISHNRLIGSGLGMTGACYGIHFSDPTGEWATKRNINAHDNEMYGCLSGVYLNTFDNVSIQDNNISNSTANGIYATVSNFLKIKGNTIARSANAGILTFSSYADISENEIFRNTQEGIYLSGSSDNKITGNFVIDNDYLNTNSRDGILISAGSDRNFVSKNKCRVTVVGTYQRYGIQVSGATCDDNIVVDNDLRQGGRTGNFYDTGTGTVTKRNFGYVTESSGTGSIASGATSAVITHACNYTPTAQDITITLTENPTNTPGAIWVDTIGATQFTVNCESNPGASNLDFSWAVRKV